MTMRPIQKWLTTILWVATVMAMVSVIGAGLWRRRELPVQKDAPPFALVDQNGQPFTLANLRGKPWIADFVFTHCAGPCPVMTMKMRQLQKKIDDRDVQFVTFSVDPDRDTPPVLKEYAHNFDADESRWHFLTGSKEMIAATSQGMLLAFEPSTGADSTTITHSTKFVLIDSDGRIRQFYDSGDEREMTALVQDAATLADDAPGH